MRKTFEEPTFHADFRKLSGEQATPILSEEQEKVICEIPRENEIIELFKRISGDDPLPAR